MSDSRVLVAASIGIAVRLLVILLYPDMQLVGDEQDYVDAARSLVAGESVRLFPFRPPLYPFFCAFVLDHLHPSVEAIRIVQAILEGFAILGIAAIAMHALDGRASRWAAWLYALYPDFIAYSHSLWSESVFLLCLVFGVLGLQWLWNSRSIARGLFAGALWGGLTLIKIFHIYLLPFFLGLFVREGRAGADRTRRAGIAAATMLTAVAVTIPWSVKISLEKGTAVYVAGVGAVNIRSGTNTYPPPQFDFPEQIHVPIDVRESMGRTESLVPFILRNPGLFISRALDKMSHLWSPNSFLIRHLYRTEKYRPMPQSLRVTVACLSMLYTMALLAGAVLGLCVARDRFLIEVGATYTALYTAMLTVTPAMSRYRLPLMIFAILACSALITRRRDLPRRLCRPRIAGLVLLALTVLAALWTIDLRKVLPALF